MGIFDKIKKTLSGAKEDENQETKVEEGGIFAVEYLRVKADGMRVRKTWKRIATLEVSKETKDLAKSNGFEYFDRGELHRIIENYNDPLLGGVFLRLRYFPNPASMAGAKTIWTIYVEETDDGDINIEPDPEIPSNAELRELYGVDYPTIAVQQQGQPQQNPMDLQSALMPMQQFVQTMMMFAEMQEQMRQAFKKLAGVEVNGESREKSKIEMLREIVEELNQYEQLRKQLGGSDDKLVEKMPWWALLLTQFAQNFGPLLGMGLMGGGMPAYQQPYLMPSQYPAQPAQQNPLPQTPAPPKPSRRDEGTAEEAQPLPEPPRPPKPKKDLSKAPRPKPVPVEVEKPKADVRKLDPEVGRELLESVSGEETAEAREGDGRNTGKKGTKKVKNSNVDEEEIEKQIEELLSEVKQAEEVAKA